MLFWLMHQQRLLLEWLAELSCATTLRAGLAPAYNPNCRDKTFYRFLFSGVIVLVGCLMPFSAESARAGYQTMSGGFYVLLGIAMVWSWWAAIAMNRPFGLKWLLWAFLPLAATGMNRGKTTFALGLLAAAAVTAVVRNRANTIPMEAWQVLWIVLCFSTGGLNAILGAAGFTLFRTGCRYSIVILAIEIGRAHV